MNKYQRGDAMTIVLVVLVVVLAGALGFVVWKNYANKKTDQQQETTQTQTEQPKAAEKVLALERWGVEVPLGDETTTYTAQYGEEDGMRYYDVKANVLESCNSGIGRVMQVDEAQAGDGTVKVGQQSYMFTPPQQVTQCDGERMPSAEEAKAQETAATNFRDNLFSKLRATEKQQ